MDDKEVLAGDTEDLRRMEEESHPIVDRRRFSEAPPCMKFTVVALALALVVAVAAIIALATGFAVSVSTNKGSSSSSGGNTNNVCLTESCVELASLILKTVDPSIDPCQDFYNFSCGLWEERNVIPEGYGRYSTFDLLNDVNQIALKKILEGDGDSDVDAVVKLRTLYKSCIDTDTINMRGATPLLDLISRTGGWPLIGMNGSEEWSINGTQFQNEKFFGSQAFFGLYVDVDDKNSSVFITQLTQSGLSLPSAANYLDNRTAPENEAALKTLMVTVFSLLNGSVPMETYMEAADAIIAFESNLAKIFVSNVDLRDPNKAYNKMTIANLSSLWPDLDWLNFARASFNSVNISVNGSEPIIVRTPSYFMNLTAVFEATNQSALENYAKWQLILGYLPYLSDDFVSAYQQFTLATSGRGGRQRYQTCIGVAQQIMPIALARPYTDFVLPNGTKSNVSEMISEVKTAFKQRLDTRTWLDNTTITRSKEKVDAITQMVAYPDQIHNDTYLSDLYAALNISEDNYFNNLLLYVTIGMQDNLAQLTQPVDKSVWLNAPTAVNAYYSPQFNQFVFLEGILNVPFFQAGWPDYFKYGALGVVIGHELTHGFDDQGQQYNKDGILEPWWTNQSIAHFKERQKCFVDQYSKYEIFGYHVNGSLTLGENIADNGGVKASYQAYQNVVKGTTPPSLPAVPYKPDQLYFIAYGQVWCSLFSPAYIQTSVKTDPHSPGNYRVIGALVNSPEFAAAFQCPSGSRMNPQDKCLMW